VGGCGGSAFFLGRGLAIGGAYMFPVIRATFSGPAPRPHPLTLSGVETPVNLAFGEAPSALESPMEFSIPYDLVRLLIQGKLRDGRLPYDGVTRSSSSPSAGETCEGCDMLLAKEHVLMAVTTLTRSRPIQFHVICFQVWNDERRAPKS
jgi:hypothetical protein